MRYTNLLILLVLCFTFPLNLQAEIYKCQDEQGQITYSATKVCDKPQTVRINSGAAKRPVSTTDTASELEQQNRLKQCNESRATLLSYQGAPFLTKVVQREGKNIKIRLNDEERKKALVDAQNEVDYWCGGDQN